MKKVVSSSIVALLLISVAAVIYFYVNNKKSTELSDFFSIPANANFIIEYHHNNNDLNSFIKSQAFEEINNLFQLQHLHSMLNRLDSLCNVEPLVSSILSENRLLISSHLTKANDFGFLYIIKSEEFNSTDEIVQVIKSITGSKTTDLSSRIYEGKEVIELQEKSTTIAFSLDQNILAVSSTPFLVEDVIRQRKIGTPIIHGDQYTAMFSKDKPSSVNIYINNLEFTKWMRLFEANNWVNGFSKQSKWLSLAVSGMNEQLNFTGEFLSDDSTDIMNLFYSNEAIAPSLPDQLPQKTIGFQYYACKHTDTYLSRRKTFIDKYPNLSEQYNSIQSQYPVNIFDEISAWFSGEAVVANFSLSSKNEAGSLLALLGVNKREKALAFLKKANESGKAVTSEKYKNHTIYHIKNSRLLPILFGPAEQTMVFNYVIFNENYLAMATSLGQLRSYIDDVSQNRILAYDAVFQKNRSTLLVKVNSWAYLNTREYFKENRDDQSFFNRNFDHLHAISQSYGVVNFVYSSQTNQVQCVLNRSPMDMFSIDQLWAFKSDSGFITKPWIIKSEKNTTYVFAQDKNFNLICLDQNGETKWTKPLGEIILGDIHPVNIYATEQTQFIFNTSSYLYLLDEKGSVVGNFPIRLPTQASNGISLVRTDDIAQTKIIVACYNGKLYAYEANGKAVSNWNFKETTSVISTPLKKLQYHNQDALVFQDEQHLYTVSLDGTILMKFKPSFKQTNTSRIHQGPKGSLSLSDENGVYINIHSANEIQSVVTGPFTNRHSFVSVVYNDSINLYFTENGVVYSYDQTGHLIKETRFASIDSYCEIIHHEDKIYIISASQNKIFAFTKDLNLCKGFPVDGSSIPTFVTTNEGKELMSVYSAENTLLLYRINN